jgi:hypothetical protein
LKTKVKHINESTRTIFNSERLIGQNFRRRSLEMAVWKRLNKDIKQICHKNEEYCFDLRRCENKF